MLQLGTWVKGGDRMMVVTDLLGRPGLKLDLYLVLPPAAWGSTVAIRTGPADLGRYVVTACRDRGYRHKNGHAVRSGVRAPTDTEEQFFALAGVPLVPRAQLTPWPNGCGLNSNTTKKKGVGLSCATS